MLIDEPTVLVPRRLAMPLLDLAVAEARRRAERGHVLDVDMRRLLSDFAAAARADIDDVPRRSDRRTDMFRGSTVESMSHGVTTATAAARLGTTPRAVIGRLHRGTLPGRQQPDGTWLVDPDSLPEEQII